MEAARVPRPSQPDLENRADLIRGLGRPSTVLAARAPIRLVFLWRGARAYCARYRVGIRMRPWHVRELGAVKNKA